MLIKINNRTFRVKDCKYSSARGLMFDDMKDKDGALIYGNSIWMPFVRQELNLIFLDKEMNIIEQKQAVPMTFHPKTWKLYESKKARYCLELKHKIKVKNGAKILIRK